jgi:hypothetical protein
MVAHCAQPSITLSLVYSILSIAAPTSRRIDSLHNGRYSDGSVARRKRVSQSGIGTSTQASSSAAYSLFGVSIIGDLIVDLFLKFSTC